MTWLQFWASIVQSVAWPLAVVFGLWLVRRHLGQLLSRLLELHLPGGTKAVFERQLEKGNAAVKQIEQPKDKQAGGTRIFYSPRAAPPTPTVAQDSRAKIMMEYAEIEEALENARGRLNVLPIYGAQFVMHVMRERALVSPEVVELFESIRTARNLAAHAKLNVSEAQASEYAVQAEVLKKVVQETVRNLPNS